MTLFWCWEAASLRGTNCKFSSLFLNGDSFGFRMGQFNRLGIIVDAVFFILRCRISGCEVRLGVVLWALKFSNQRRGVQHCFLYLCSKVVVAGGSWHWTVPRSFCPSQFEWTQQLHGICRHCEIELQPVAVIISKVDNLLLSHGHS